jgi:hypothetical protein
MKKAHVLPSRVSGLGAARPCAWLAGAALLLTPAGSARADCVAPTPRVIWSAPAAGAVDVPVDADLLLLTEAIDLDAAALSLFVGGLRELPIEPGSALPGHYGLPELEPNQPHTIVVRPFDGTPITIDFTTGERRASGGGGALELTAVSQAVYATGLVEPLCSDVLSRDSCFDTGVPPVRTFEVDAGLSPVGEHSLWAIELFRLDIQDSVYLGTGPFWSSWPAACGSPRDFGWGREVEYRLHNIGESGVIRESNTLALTFGPPSPSPPPSDYDRPGHIICSASVGSAPSPSPLVAAGALALGAWCCRRRARARRARLAH